ncbi:hypothetical protein VPNG_02778 [Cytospora leucostoma]|uniref:Uncharacterized protein n=1 Tax=Cytospora leucostoma TaxID=1230097 RepID=A0A423XJ55_9PEZI|nr:hypothetical protein VPNG_02778 [Cytospora leucostoma]
MTVRPSLRLSLVVCLWTLASLGMNEAVMKSHSMNREFTAVASGMADEIESAREGDKSGYNYRV